MFNFAGPSRGPLSALPSIVFSVYFYLPKSQNTKKITKNRKKVPKYLVISNFLCNFAAYSVNALRAAYIFL